MTSLTWDSIAGGAQRRFVARVSRGLSPRTKRAACVAQVYD